MASIVKRNNSHCVVYSYKDTNGKTKQKWETYSTSAEAKKRKAQIEFEQENGIFILPTVETVSQLLEEYVAIYGVKSWAISTYQSKIGLIENYIKPLIGDFKLKDLTPILMDKFYNSLPKVKAVVVNNRKPKSEFVTPNTIAEIHKILRHAFNQAVKWEIMIRNPVLNANLPEATHQKREIWTVESLSQALEVCENDILALAINVAFACCLRIGELLGLTWDMVEISEKSIAENRAFIYINKELQRVNRKIFETLEGKDVLLTFPSIKPGTKTLLVLKTPKNETSVRRVFLPRTVALMFVERKRQIEELKELFGDEFHDYNLVFCQSSGRPIEGQVINRAMKKVIQDNELPEVVFHSLRHTSVTYKLKWNGGDMKSVQGDSGHSTIDMIAEVYSHIIDEDRRANAQTMENKFYNGETDTIPIPKFESVVEMTNQPAVSIEKTEEVQTTETQEDFVAIIGKLLSNPEARTILKTLAQTI